MAEAAMLVHSASPSKPVRSTAMRALRLGLPPVCSLKPTMSLAFRYYMFLSSSVILLCNLPFPQSLRDSRPYI
ncbi:hypothetical protein IQ06DRAFT_291833 [Phaeosphaeriaceae sp. SRC1lsM3a]|nr:hypothetical protein IQ06DRAFT_291833 [Stagonospora sp. SRC1lsM3a]